MAAPEEFDFLSPAQRSCINLGKTEPCVKKAVHLLQQLSNHDYRVILGNTAPQEMCIKGTSINPQHDWSVALAKALDLILRMERDRQETLLKYDEEKEKVKSLSLKYDLESKKRLDSLETIVQTEQEKSVEMFKELQSTSEKERKALLDVLCELSVIDARHSQLQKNENRLLRNIKLLEEKTCDEEQKITQIYQLQEKISQELSLARKALSGLEEQVIITDKKLLSDKKDIERRLTMARRNLLGAREELQDEEKRIEELHSTIVRCQEEIETTLKLKEELETSTATTIKDIESVHSEVCELQAECNKVERINQETERRNRNLRLDLRKECEVLKAVNSKHRSDVERAQQIVQELKDKREETEQEIDRITEEICLCRKQQEDDKKAVERGNKELIRLEKQLELSDAQFTNLKRLNNELCAHFEREKAEIESEEYKLKEAVQKLKRKIKESDSKQKKLKEQEREAKETLCVTETKAETMSKELKTTMENIHVVNSQFSKQVEEMETLCTRQKNTINVLNPEISTLKAKYETAVETLGHEAEDMEILAGEIQDEFHQKQDISENLVKRQRLLQERIQELNKAIASTQKMKHKIETETNCLEQEVNELSRTVTTEMDKELRIEQELLGIKDFRKEAEEKLEQYKKNRECYIEQLTEKLSSSLTRNGQLRWEFHRHQGEYMALKSRLFKDMARRGDSLETAWNLSQLCQLQYHLSWQLQIGLKHTSQLCANTLVSCQRMQERNNVCLKNIHRDLQQQLHLKPKESETLS